LTYLRSILSSCRPFAIKATLMNRLHRPWLLNSQVAAKKLRLSRKIKLPRNRRLKSMFNRPPKLGLVSRNKLRPRPKLRCRQRLNNKSSRPPPSSKHKKSSRRRKKRSRLRLLPPRVRLSS